MPPTKRQSTRSRLTKKRMAMAAARATESLDQQKERQQADRTAKAAARAAETSDQRKDRQQADRKTKALKRAAETLEEQQDVKASQQTINVPFVPKIVAPLKLPTTSNEASLTLAFLDAESQTDHISEQKKISEPVHQRLLAFRVPVNSELYRNIRAADLRASDRAQEALQYFNMPITAATETQRELEESDGNSTPSVDVGRVKREPGEYATESTPRFHGTPRTPSLCGQCTPSVCGTSGFHEVQVMFEPEECATDNTQHFHEVQVMFEPEECATDSTQHFHEVQVKFEPEECATDSTQHFQVMQVRSDFEPAESAADTDTPHFDVVQVKTEPEESATESTSSFDVVREILNQ